MSDTDAQTDEKTGEDAQRAAEAADRWQQRTEPREQKQRALDRHQYLSADSRERLLRWLDRHERWRAALQQPHDIDAAGPVDASVTVAGSTAAAGAEPAPGTPPLPHDIDDAGFEKAVGDTQDMLSVEFFELGLAAARCVGRVITGGRPNGTGFLVADGLMLTNEHVLRTENEARSSRLELDLEDNRIGEARQVQVFALDPDRFFLAHRALDFTLVAVQATSLTGAPLKSYGVLPLIGEEGKVRIGEAVNVVQHPRGDLKQVAFRNNRLVDLPEGQEMGAFFHYETDTDRGSSGSPVLNDFWEVVALHHSGVPATDAQGRLVDRHGDPVVAADRSTWHWVANEGVRVSRVVKAVKAADLPPRMQPIRDEAVTTWEQRADPVVAVAVARHDRGAPDPSLRAALNQAAARTPEHPRPGAP